MHSFVYLSSCHLFAQKKSILSCDAKRKCFFQVFDSCLEEASPPINTNRLIDWVPYKNSIQFCSTKSQQKSSQGGSYCKVRTIIQKTTTVRRSPWASTKKTFNRKKPLSEQGSERGSICCDWLGGEGNGVIQSWICSSLFIVLFLRTRTCFHYWLEIIM